MYYSNNLLAHTCIVFYKFTLLKLHTSSYTNGYGSYKQSKPLVSIL